MQGSLPLHRETQWTKECKCHYASADCFLPAELQCVPERLQPVDCLFQAYLLDYQKLFKMAAQVFIYPPFPFLLVFFS